MKRRNFIAGVGAAALLPFAARAQSPTMPVIGFLHAGSPEQNVTRLAAFFRGLKAAGLVDGQNVAIEYRWARGRDEQLPAMAADLIRRQVTVIATPGSTAATVAAKAATSTVPIVFTTGADPVALGFVASLSRPGGNATGVTSLNAEMGAKRLGLMRELVPQASRYFAFTNPTSQLTAPFVRELKAGAASLGVHIDVLHASNVAEIETAFANLPPPPGSVLMFCPDTFFYSQRAQIAALTARYAIPAIFDDRAYVEAGGLINYGADWPTLMELAGRYTARVIGGEKPADLPVVQSTKFELVINRKTANALGVAVPPTLLSLADEVIE